MVTIVAIAITAAAAATQPVQKLPNMCVVVLIFSLQNFIFSGWKLASSVSSK